MAKKSLLIITTLLIALAAGGGEMYFYNQRQTQLRRTLVPNIATDRLPVARLNQPYSQPVQAVLVGAKTKPMIESTNLPETFNLTDCVTTYNQLDLPTPNSVT